MFSSLPDRPKLWAPPLAVDDDDDDDHCISIVLGDGSEWDDAWPLDSKPRLVSSSPSFSTTTSVPSLVPVIPSLRKPYASLTPDLPTLPEKPSSSEKARHNSKNHTSRSRSRSRNRNRVSSHTTTQPASHTPSEEAGTAAPQHLLALFTSGVRHVAALEVRGQSGILGGPYIESIVCGDHVVLLAGEAALSVRGGRPESATRAIAACPARYGAPESLPSAMALAHAHCALHDVFACDTRLAPAEDYYDILSGFVTALTDWPAVTTRTTEPVERRVLELLGLPPLSHSSGFSLGLRSQSIEVSLHSGGKARPVCGAGLVPKMTDKGLVWAASQQTLLEGWFPWLFVEPLGLCDDVAQGYVRLLGAMRTSLAMHSRLFNLAKRARPVACTKRTETTRIAYGLQTIGVLWHVFAMAEEDGHYPVTTIWSGRVEEPRHMTQATAILRQIGAEAKPRSRSVRDWLTCVCVDSEGVSPSAPIPISSGVAHLNLPPGIPIPGNTHPINTSNPSTAGPSPVTQPQTNNVTPEPSWKPWIEPFQPQRAPPTASTPADPSKPTSSAITSGRVSTVPPSSATDSAPTEHIWAPAPRQLPISWDSWHSAPPPAYQPTPPPFNYSARYEYAWPLPSASLAIRPGVSSAALPVPSASWQSSHRSISPISVIPMKRSASTLSALAQPGPSFSLVAGVFTHSPSTSRASSTAPA